MRFIDADALIGNVPSTSADIFENCRNCRLLDEDQVKEIIKNAPTIDALPVVHGRWILDQYRWLCSECHENPTFGMGYVQSERGLYNYCPHCGAKMDEVSE